MLPALIVHFFAGGILIVICLHTQMYLYSALDFTHHQSILEIMHTWF